MPMFNPVKIVHSSNDLKGGRKGVGVELYVENFPSGPLVMLNVFGENEHGNRTESEVALSKGELMLLGYRMLTLSRLMR